MTRDAALDALREADRRARARSQTEFDRPLVLEAGAGTGKTATLVARVLAWCLGPGWRRAEAELDAAAARAGRSGDVPAERIAAQVLEGVVAITFTEAAAAEMADRIALALDEIGKGELPVGLLPELVAAAGAQARPRAAALLVALDHLVVATIHAFCRRVLAGAPLEAGVRPGFTVDADGQVLAAVVQEVVGNSFAAALRQGRRHPLVTLAARGHGPAEVAAALELLAARATPARALSGDPADARAVADLAAELRQRAAELHSIVARPVGDMRPASNAVKLAAAVASLGACPDGPLEAIAAAVQAALPPALVAHLGKWRKGAFGNAEEEHLGPVKDEVMRGCGALAELAGHLVRLDPALLRLAWEALGPLLGEVHARLRARGAETFAALLADAHELLLRHPSVRRAVRAGIVQLLVDEFQDTDVRQCEILRLLALDGERGERPGLFLIGDPKQSIYGWRNADLEAYETFLAAVREAGGEVLSLVVNFRSDPEILAEVERVLAPVMVREPGVQPEFQPLLPSPPPAPGRAPLPPGLAPVEHWISWAADELAAGRPEATSAQDAVELEARSLALDLGALHRTGAMWRDAAVLLRSTGDLDVYLQAFRESGVPYVVERDRSYYRRREVIEAAALVRAVLDPGDHLALLTVLRSSIVGVPDAALIPLWERGLADRASGLSRPDAAVLRRLAGDLERVAATLPADVPGLERVRGWERNLTEFLAHLAELREAFEREPAAEFVERLRTATLFEASESARSVGAYRVANLDRFFRSLLAAMEAGDDPQAVLRALRVAVAEAAEAEEGRPLASAEDAVRVMTIHKAKGLDFPHVYLMQAHRRSRSGVRPLNDVESASGRVEAVLLGAPTPGWHRVEARRRRVEGAELVRTLYVAMTRAKRRLVVAGSRPAAPARSPASHADLLAGREAPPDGLAATAARLHASGGDRIDAAGARWRFPALATMPAGSDRETERERPALPIGELAARSERLAALRLRAAERMERPFSAAASEEAHRLLGEGAVEAAFGDPGAEEGSTPARRAREAAREAAAAAGTAVHRALEAVELDGDLAAALARQRALLPAYLDALLAGETRDAALVRAARVLDGFAASALVERLSEIAPHVVAREVAVLLPPGGAAEAPVGFVSGAIDLVYRDPGTGGLVVADYKTDEVATDAEIAARAAAYAAQGAAYVRALREALDLAAPPRFELWFLQPARIVRLD